MFLLVLLPGVDLVTYLRIYVFTYLCVTQVAVFFTWRNGFWFIASCWYWWCVIYIVICVLWRWTNVLILKGCIWFISCWICFKLITLDFGCFDDKWIVVCTCYRWWCATRFLQCLYLCMTFVNHTQIIFIH
jgi:hypothetical protein